MPQPKWLILDPERKIDQEKWLTDRVTCDIKDNLDRYSEYIAEIVKEFEDQFPTNILIKKYSRDGRKKTFIGWETEQEAQVRCADRPHQLRKWLQNHKTRLANGAVKMPGFLKLRPFRDNVSASTSRAKSSRDLFITDHPEIRKQITEAARAEGITDPHEITRRVNNSYSEAYKNASDDERLKYQRLSEEDKLRKAAEHEKTRDVTSQGDSLTADQNDRSFVLQELHFSLQNIISHYASQTDTEIFLLYGGRAADGQLTKWMLSNHPDSSDNFVDLITSPDNPAFPILHEFDQFVLCQWPAVTLQSVSDPVSVKQAIPATSESVAPSLTTHLITPTPALAVDLSSPSIPIPTVPLGVSSPPINHAALPVSLETPDGVFTESGPSTIAPVEPEPCDQLPPTELPVPVSPTSDSNQTLDCIPTDSGPVTVTPVPSAGGTSPVLHPQDATTTPSLLVESVQPTAATAPRHQLRRKKQGPNVEKKSTRASPFSDIFP